MGMIQAYKMAIKSIIGNKVRSFLTMLGVIIGVASVISAVGFAQGATQKVTESIQGLGTNLIEVNINSGMSSTKVTFDDFKKFEEDAKGEIKAIAPGLQGSAKVKSGIKLRDTALIGTTQDYQIVKGCYVQSGRFISDMDVKYRQKVAVIGTAVVKDLFKGSNPLGKDIKINGQPFKIIGVKQQKFNARPKTEDDCIILPVNVFQRVMSLSDLSNVDIQVSKSEYVNDVMGKLKSFLTEKLKKQDAFYLFDQTELLKELDKTTGMLMMILGGIAAISLIVGGIGIMNIMFVSVTERTREIGIRKALGAKRRIILIQFLIEALMITSIGGVIGIGLGFGVIKGIISNFVPEVYSAMWTSVSFGISVLVGVIFGLFPAYKASKLSPIEALRYE